MSQTHDIDNEPPFFLDLDPYESFSGSHHLEGYVREPQDPHSASHDLSLTPPSSSSFPASHWYFRQSAVSNSNMSDQASSPSKGKGVSQPVDIQRRESVELQIDTLPAVGSSSSSGNYSLAQPWAFPSPSIESFDIHNTYPDDAAVAVAVDPSDENVGEASGLSGKGKGRERPPMLPPLVFMPTALEYEPIEWPSSLDMSPQTAGPSSYGSGFTTISSPESEQSNDVTPPATPEVAAPIEHVPARRRSLSSLSLRSTRSLSALNIPKVKAKLTGSRTPGNIARKLLFKKGRDANAAETSPATPATTPTRVIDTEMLSGAEIGRGNCFLPWAPPLKSCMSPPVGTLIDIDVDLSGTISPVVPTYRAGPHTEAAIQRAKGRSYSSPFPLPSSPLDVVPLTPADIFEPIPIEVPNYFEEYLPRELRLQVLASLVDIHEAEQLRNLSSGKWTALTAAKTRNKWVGVEKGIRELLRLSRVSKAWKSLVYDGQLWASLLDLPPSILSRICESAGGFVRRIDFAGLRNLSDAMLLDMTDNLCYDSFTPSLISSTRVTSINLQGCTTLTTHSLHYLLIRAPALQSLCVKGLTAVLDSTCAILSTYCPNLVSLDMSRCVNLSGDGIRKMAVSALDRGDKLHVKTLRLVGLRHVTDETMRCLGTAAPDLEVLDLSYASSLHNSAVEAFVSLTEEEAKDFESVQLTARQAGRDTTDSTRIWRRVTRLRHIALSSCFMLTDHACSHLAHAVPRLELLELAGIGADLQDDGLVRLLETTPYIRKVDLEDASEITDAVLAALTPQPDESLAPARRGAPPPPPQPGHALEHLIISYAGDVTNEALTQLIRSCTRLRVLEADNTRMGSAVMKEFVRLSHQRNMVDPYLAANDCRGIGEHAVKDLAYLTRPRRGWIAWAARELKFLDARDKEGLGVGQDECDEKRVVLKTFYSWQTVDAVRAAREKKRKAARRHGNGSSSSASGSEGGGFGYPAARTPWWAPGGRRSGTASPMAMPGVNNGDGCTIM